MLKIFPQNTKHELVKKMLQSLRSNVWKVALTKQSLQFDTSRWTPMTSGKFKVQQQKQIQGRRDHSISLKLNDKWSKWKDANDVFKKNVKFCIIISYYFLILFLPLASLSFQQSLLHYWLCLSAYSGAL